MAIGLETTSNVYTYELGALPFIAVGMGAGLGAMMGSTGRNFLINGDQNVYRNKKKS